MVTAVVPVRSGSQRVKNKNLRPFANSTLLDIKIEVLKRVSNVDRIVVNTDSDEALEVARRLGVEGVRRDAYYASSKCSGSEYFEHLGRVTETDVFVYAPVTSPLVRPETIGNCVSEFLSGGDYDCIATVSAVKEFLWLDGKAINYNPSNAPNSQELPNVVALNFACSVISRENLIRYRNIIGARPRFVTINEVESVDIDTPLDYFVAEQLYKRIILGGEALS